MAKRRRSKSPPLTRYLIALAALGRAERRKAAAEASIKRLRPKVKRYEATLPVSERRAALAKIEERAAAKKRSKDAWADAAATLQSMAATANATVEWLTKKSIKSDKTKTALLGLFIRCGSDDVLVWRPRSGYQKGYFRDILSEKGRRSLTPLEGAPTP